MGILYIAVRLIKHVVFGQCLLKHVVLNSFSNWTHFQLLFSFLQWNVKMVIPWWFCLAFTIRLSMIDFRYNLPDLFHFHDWQSHIYFILKVEYTPCVIIQDCWVLLTEFMQGFLGNVFVLKVPSTFTNKPDNYQPLDTIHQYLDQFNQFRKQVTPRWW